MSITLGPDYARRRAAQLAYEKTGVEDYTYIRGDYSSRINADQETLALGAGLGALVGPEVFMARHLEDRLSNPSLRPPVIWLDIGSGVGITAQRLAVYFREAIAKNQLVVAATNLAASHNDYANSRLAREVAPLRNAGGSEARFLSSPFSRLIRQTVSLANGDSVPLKGNVDLVHERHSLTAWSQIPELHIRQIGHLLVSEGGLYMVPPFNTTCPKTIDGNTYFDSQLEGVSLAHQALQDDFGLTLSSESVGNQFGDAAYLLYRGPDSDIFAQLEYS